MKEINKNSIDELLIKFLANSANEQEKLDVENWLTESSDNQNYFNRFKEVWNMSDNFNQYQQIDTEFSLKNVKNRIDFNQKDSTKIRPLWFTMKIAASVVLLIGLYFLISNTQKSTEQSTAWLKIESLQKTKMVELPDGTIVTLNKESQIEYPEKFEGNERLVKFKGEAYFEVAKNKEKPFIIETDKAKTKVVGTAFNLRALENESNTSIIITEGIVEFSGKTETTKVPIRLVKGEKAVLNKIIVKDINKDPNFLSWKTGVFNFENHKIEDALGLFSNFYQVEFKLKDTTLNNLTIGGNYDLELKELKELIDILEMTLGIDIEKENEVYWLKKKAH